MRGSKAELPEHAFVPRKAADQDHTEKFDDQGLLKTQVLAEEPVSKAYEFALNWQTDAHEWDDEDIEDAANIMELIGLGDVAHQLRAGLRDEHHATVHTPIMIHNEFAAAEGITTDEFHKHMNNIHRELLVKPLVNKLFPGLASTAPCCKHTGCANKAMHGADRCVNHAMTREQLHAELQAKLDAQVDGESVALMPIMQCPNCGDGVDVVTFGIRGNPGDEAWAFRCNFCSEHAAPVNYEDWFETVKWNPMCVRNDKGEKVHQGITPTFAQYVMERKELSDLEKSLGDAIPEPTRRYLNAPVHVKPDAHGGCKAVCIVEPTKDEWEDPPDGLRSLYWKMPARGWGGLILADSHQTAHEAVRKHHDVPDHESVEIFEG